MSVSFIVQVKRAVGDCLKIQLRIAIRQVRHPGIARKQTCEIIKGLADSTTTFVSGILTVRPPGLTSEVGKRAEVSQYGIKGVNNQQDSTTAGSCPLESVQILRLQNGDSVIA